MSEFQRIAIVNRGEAAVRFIRALRDYNRERGTALEAIAFYTEADQGAPFVRLADEAYALGPALRPSENGSMVSAYTHLPSLLSALEAAKVDAVWPGWGFVAERADFVEALEARGITFIGPSAAAMRLLGDKIAAKRIADAAQVPMAAWHLIEDGETLEVTQAAASKIGYPLVVKASAGGGGRGIRVVSNAEQLAASLHAVREEVRRSFGGGGLFLEACVSAARHIEVQLIVGADGKGATLGLRDCTIQRRHQKIIEEAPSPVVSEELGQLLQAAAIRLGEAVGYRGVGTVEFLVEPTSSFAHFLEVNTRLQVEHTVTECVSGIDLVQVQIDIARNLDWSHWQPFDGLRGYAVEVRINAEDPERGFVPSPGLVRVFRAPLGPGIRVDSGIVEGVRIAAEFDSMVAKLIAYGRDRDQAYARLGRALRELELVLEDGATNKTFLLSLIEAPEVRSGLADTGWLDRKEALQDSFSWEFEALCATAILVRREALEKACEGFYVDVQEGIPWPVRTAASGSISLSLRGRNVTFEAHALGDNRFFVGLPGSLYLATFEARHPGAGVLSIMSEHGMLRHEVLYAHGRSGFTIEVDGVIHRIELASGGSVTSPTPALVVGMHVAEGERVEEGQRLVTLEAMKMEVPVFARTSGIVSGLLCRVNEQVQAGQVLMRIDLGTASKAQMSDNSSQLSLPARPPLPRPLARLVTCPDGERCFDPRRLDDLTDLEAQQTMTRLVEVVKAHLLGWEIPPKVLADVHRLLAAEEFFRLIARPARWLPLAQLFAYFSDLELLFEQPVDGPDMPGTMRSEHLFFARCRSLDANTLTPSHPAFELALERMAAHYGVDSLEPSPKLREALHRMAIAHADEERYPLMNQLLRVLMALHAAGASFQVDRELELWLVRIAETARPNRSSLRDNARQARYLLFRRERKSTASLGPSLAARLSNLETLRVGEDTELQSLLSLIYGSSASFELVVREPELWAYEVLSESGTRSLTVALNGVESISAMMRVRPWLDPLIEKGPFEVHLLLVGRHEGSPETWSQPSYPSASHPANLTRVALSYSDGQKVWHRSLVPSMSGDLEEESWLRDIHPERARRLELWRLDGFEVEQLETGSDLSEGIEGGALLAFKVQSRSNPRDERIIVIAELPRSPYLSDEPPTRRPPSPDHLRAMRELDFAFLESLRIIREAQARRKSNERYYLNRMILAFQRPLEATPQTLMAIARRLEGATRGHGLQKVVVRTKVPREQGLVDSVFSFAVRGRHRLEVRETAPSLAPMRSASDYYVKAERARRMGVMYPYELIHSILGTASATAAVAAHPDLARAGARFEELDLDSSGELVTVNRGFGENKAGVVLGLLTHRTRKHPEGMTRVFVASDPTMAMGALSEPECRRVLAAIDLAEQRNLPLEWLPVSSGAKIAMDSGTENLDWTARVLRRLIDFTQAGGEVNIIVAGVNVGAQSYWNAEATMLMHTKGVLIQTIDGSMVLTGKKALEVSGSVAAEDERGIGGFERVMGRNGQAQLFARNVGDAYRLLFEHYDYGYVSPGERGPRRFETQDPASRSILESPYEEPSQPLTKLSEFFSEEKNPGRKRPFAIREVMRATMDQDSSYLERFGAMEGAETAIVWDTHIGGHSVRLLGFESKPLARRDKAPMDGPDRYTGGTLFPLSSKKVARAINQVSGNRPVVVLANLSGFDGSPESMRKLQLEYGAEIGRAVVNFKGPIVFCVIGRYHGGAYVVFSKALNEELVAIAVQGAYASVIGGAPAAAVVFPREVRQRALKDARMRPYRESLDAAVTEQAKAEAKSAFDEALSGLILEHQGKLAQEFDRIHDVHRAVAVGSLDAVIAPDQLRAEIIRILDERVAGIASEENRA